MFLQFLAESFKFIISLILKLWARETVLIFNRNFWMRYSLIVANFHILENSWKRVPSISSRDLKLIINYGSCVTALISNGNFWTRHSHVFPFFTAILDETFTHVTYRLEGELCPNVLPLLPKVISEGLGSIKIKVFQHLLCLLIKNRNFLLHIHVQTIEIMNFSSTLQP